jgi:hypothetical protein
MCLIELVFHELLSKSGFIGHQTVSRYRPHHVSFLSFPHPLALQQ